MISLKQVRDHVNDIESFECPIQDIIDNLYIGPQGELIEAIDLFNFRYETNLGITKNFTLKPGCYNQIKKDYTDWVLRWDLKPRGIRSLFDRIDNFAWRKRDFRLDLLNLEDKCISLRSHGLSWQDNTEQFTMELDKIKKHMSIELQQCKELYPDIDIHVKIVPSSQNSRSHLNRRGYHYPRTSFPDNFIVTDNPQDYALLIYMHFKNPTITTHVLNSQGVVDRYDIDCGNIIMVSGTLLLPLISRHWNRDTFREDTENKNNMIYYLEGADFSYYKD